MCSLLGTFVYDHVLQRCRHTCMLQKSPSKLPPSTMKRTASVAAKTLFADGRHPAEEREEAAREEAARGEAAARKQAVLAMNKKAAIYKQAAGALSAWNPQTCYSRDTRQVCGPAASHYPLYLHTRADN